MVCRGQAVHIGTSAELFLCGFGIYANTIDLL